VAWESRVRPPYAIAQAGTAVDGGAIVVACREPSMSVKRKVTVPVGRSAIADLHPMLISA
jgi:hypothetical protein